LDATLQKPIPSSLDRFLRQPETVADTGLDYGLILDLTLKTIYYAGRPSARSICDRVCLAFSVIEGVLSFLRREELVEIVGSIGVMEQDYQYSLTSKGAAKVRELLDQNLYVGPAPVPFDVYEAVVALQSIATLDSSPAKLDQAFHNLVLAPETVEQVGTALGSGRSVFLYGPPGNGKSTIAERLIGLLSQAIYIPYAFEYNGQIVRVHDPRIHLDASEDVAAAPGMPGSITNQPENRDMRWALSRRPLVIGGGEVTLADLELRYSPISKYYVAPMQVKANNGVLVIDDFGRQLLRPEELLNRWMVPMDRQVDHLVFQTGETLTIPFDMLLVFATNLAPSQLGDEAFFRRIRHKIRISDPDLASFKSILKDVTEGQGMTYDEETADYLIRHHYEGQGRPFRGVHPRDLIAMIQDMAKYRNEVPVFNPEWIDRACRSYFIDD
jgi:predicted ATPase with chaperone activity